MLEAANTAGFLTMPEAARELLRAPGGMALRDENPLGFAEEMLSRELAAYEESRQHKGLIIFDRGFPDIAGFLDISGLPVPAELDRICRSCRYDGPIFRAAPWKAIYLPDPERIQTWDEAVASDAAILSAWRRYGYHPIDLPQVSVNQRLSFVKQHVAG